MRSLLSSLLLCVPLIVGAGYILITDADPADSWSTPDQRAGAPAAIDAAALVEARRAAGEASTQAGFLTSGTSELAKGVGEATANIDTLIQAIEDAKNGSQELSKGMVELQAATGQMGEGANRLATGVEQAVGQITGIEQVRSQLVTSLDAYIKEFSASTDPQILALRDQLTVFRDQANAIAIDQASLGQLGELQSGARELSNQLHAAGNPYRDGIYRATTGSQDLAAGLAQLDNEVEAAMGGVDDLGSGAGKIDDMAQRTADKIGAITRAMPTGTTTTAHTLAPLYALLIAVAMVLGAVLRGRDTLWAALAVGAAGAGLFALLGSGLTPVSILGALAITVLTCVGTMLGSSALVRAFGQRTGRALSIAGALLQVGVVAWTWSTAITSDLGTWLLGASSLMPLHYATVGLSTLGNTMNPEQLLLSGGVLLGCLLCAAGANWAQRRSATEL